MFEKYKEYNISYEGKFLCSISALNKKSVIEYIRDEYKDRTRVITMNNCFIKSKYFMKDFSINLSNNE